MTSSNLQSPSSARNYGVDLLRLFAMFSIVLLHVIGQGGSTGHQAFASPAYFGFYTLRFLNEYAMNAFGMITGYVLVQSHLKISRLLSLWAEVLFYSIGISLLFILKDRSVVPILRDEFYTMIFPITSRRYWYISSYFCLCLFIPLINAGLEKLSLKETRNMLIGLFLLICVFGSLNIRRNDPFRMDYGFSTAWLGVLYLFGAACRKYDLPHKIHPFICCLGIVICILGTLFFKYMMDLHSWQLKYTLEWMMMSNVSITYTLCAFFMLNLFAQLKPGINLQKVISFLAPAALGVYLIHTHTMIWENLITDCSSGFADDPFPIFIIKTLGLSLSIFAICIAIDLIRIRLFQILRITHLCNRLGQHFSTLLSK